MLKDINLIQPKNMWCFECLYATVSSWFNRGYEMMFYDAWKFNFDKEKGSRLGEQIAPPNWNVEKNLEKFHGVKISMCNISDKEVFIETIKNELAMDKPASVLFNSFYSHWTPEEKRLANHVGPYLIVGIADDNMGFIVRDPHLNLVLKKAVYLSMENCKLGSLGYATFSKVNNDYEKSDIKEIIKYILQSNDNENSINKIYSFADSMEFSLDFNNEINNIKNVTQAPIISSLETISRSRALFGLTIQYLSKIYNIEKLNYISNDFNHVASLWHVIEATLTKAFFASNLKESQIKDLSNRIRDIAKYESNISNSLEKLLLTDNEEKSFIIENSCISDQRIFVKLEPFYNNCGFSSRVSIDCKADFTGVGEYLLSENFPSGELLKVENMEFKLPVVQEWVCDNITCNNQVIDVNCENCSNVMILACADYEDFSINLTLMFENGESEKILISVTNFWQENSMFNESIAWSGRKVVKIGEQWEASDRLHNIFANKYKINNNNKLSSIVLPDCPNIHIFAITLC